MTRRSQSAVIVQDNLPTPERYRQGAGLKHVAAEISSSGYTVSIRAEDRCPLAVHMMHRDNQLGPDADRLRDAAVRYRDLYDAAHPKSCGSIYDGVAMPPEQYREPDPTKAQEAWHRASCDLTWPGRCWLDTLVIGDVVPRTVLDRARTVEALDHVARYFGL